MKYAVIKTGGKQYKVMPGDIVEVERLGTEANKEITFPEVLLYTADGTVKIGQPLVSGVTVAGTVVANVRGEKIRVSKYKAKVRYRKVRGHRQELTQVRIDDIFEGARPAKKADEKPTAKDVKPASTEKVEAASAKPSAKPARKAAVKTAKK